MRALSELQELVLTMDFESLSVKRNILRKPFPAAYTADDFQSAVWGNIAVYLIGDLAPVADMIASKRSALSMFVTNPDNGNEGEKRNENLKGNKPNDLSFWP